MVLLIAIQAHAQHSSHDAEPARAVEPKTQSTSVKKDEPRAPVQVTAAEQAKIGLKTAKAEKSAMSHSIRTVGTISADQSKEAHIHTKVNGWIERIFADSVGKQVKSGQALYELYSPELYSTVEELIASRKQGSPGKEISQAAAERLKLWDVPQKEIDQLVRSGKSKRAVTFYSPVSGYVVRKSAINGMYVTPDMELYYIADLSKVWLIVTLYEYDLPSVSVGDEASIDLPYDPGKSIKGKLGYIYPEIEAETRTAKARIEIDNPKQLLKPGMYANVEIKKSIGEALSIPDDSVIDTGARKIVFLKRDATRFEPREIKVGARINGRFVVLSGLSVGDEVVTSAHFLIDAESKMRAALEKGSPSNAGHGGHGGK